MMRPEQYIGRPIRSLQTMLRTLARVDGRLPSVVPDGIYGADTEKAVRAFQQRAGLPVTGQTDNRTWNAIAAAYAAQSPQVLPATPLRIRWTPGQVILENSRNTHLFLMQSMLLALRRYYGNAPALEVTGVHDANSVAAIRWLQARAALPQTGQIDQTTWAYLAGLYELSTGDGELSLSKNIEKVDET